MAETVKIPGELESTATGNKVVDVANVKDKTQGNKSQAQINTEHETALADRYTKAETYNKSELNNMITTPNQEYVSVTATDQTTAATDVLPATGAADKVYRVGNWDGTQYDVTCYSEYAWNGSAYVHLSTKTQIGEVFDISAYHATGGTLATYADLSAALDSNNGGGVPLSLQKGGMSIEFVCSSDNKYVQYRLMSDTFNTTEANWQGVDDVPTAGSENLVKSGGVADIIYNKGKFVNGKGGIKELYVFDNSVDLHTLHLVYKNKDGYWYVVFHDSTGTTKSAITSLYTSQPNGILPIYKYDDIAVTIGYIIIDWSYFKDGITALVAELKDTAFDITYSPNICNLLQNQYKPIIPWSGKISVIGDSISTYKGTMPEGYVTNYPNTVQNVTTLQEMWWHQLLGISGSQLEVNASYSGSSASDISEYGPTFYERVSVLGTPDIIIVALGSNDSLYNAPLGDYDYTTETQSLSESEFIPAYTKGVKALMENYPSATIVLVLLQMGEDYANAIINIGKHYDLKVADCRDYPGFAPNNIHPSKVGMRVISQLFVSSYVIGKVDDKPTPNSNKLVTSGGVADVYGSYIENPEYIEAKTDADDKLLEARKNDGTKIEFGNLEVKGSFVNKGLQEQFNTKVDKETGKSLINSNFAISQDVVDNPEWMQITTDNNDRILSGRDNGGKKREFVGFETPELKTKKLILGKTEILEEDYNNESASVKELNEAYLRCGKYGVAASPITPSMFDDTTLLANTLNSAFENYAILCKCSKYSFYPFNLNDLSNGRFYFKINHNFRKQVVVEGMDYATMAAFINYEFTQPINRFNDAILNKTNGINASINTQMRVGEPSAIVSDDMQTLYIYCSSLYRYKSIDGINYELDHNLTIGGVQVTTSNPEYLMHVNVNYIDGVYYLIGTHGNQQPLVLWTSTDGWNFTKVGTLLEIGDTINSNSETIGNFGNTFLHKDAGTGKWYLYYEITKSVGAVGWEICIATCPDITVERESGKYGVWTQYADNPAFPAGVDTYTSRTTGKGNPNIVCGLNNRPLKYNGKYYIYIHGNTSWGGVAIMRYYSIDLIHWTYDGIVYNNRDIPTAGETAPGNGDHCIVEFKGRTLLFYTWDINDYPRPEYVKLTIDDRPIHEILSIEC